MGTLASYVHVTHPDGYSVQLAPGEPVPDWAVPLVTNPKAWVGGQLPAPATSAASTPDQEEVEPPPPPQSGGDPDVPPPAASPDTQTLKAPPRGGAGSGREAWSAYARVAGHDAAADLGTREEIIAALESAGVPVE